MVMPAGVKLDWQRGDGNVKVGRRRELRKTRKARKWKNESWINSFRVFRAFHSQDR